LGNTFELEIDKQGRINLPDNFIKKINIVKDVLFIGIGTKIEL
jgi:MraZ protein